MIAMIIFALGLIVVSVSISNGEWETAAIFGGITLIMLIACALELQSTRAHLNWIDYWARGGPNGKAKRREVYDYRMKGGLNEPGVVSKREQRLAAKKRADYVERIRDGYEPPISRKRRNGASKVCHYCGRMVSVNGRIVVTADGDMIEYVCPNCNRRNLTKLGA